jgi:putative ABC transport system permease protein
MNRFNWNTAFKIAWREARASSGKFLFVVLAVALGVGSLTGVRGFSQAFASMLHREARALMAADLSVRIFSLPSPEQLAALEKIDRQGVVRTQVTETLSMVSSTAVPDPLLISIKAVDPTLFPFYGEVVLNPAGNLKERLGPDSVLVSDDVPLRLKVNPGDSVLIGGQPFRVGGVIVKEPDRMSGSMNVGPRVMMSTEGLMRTGLIRMGSRAAQRFLFRLPTGSVKLASIKADLKRAFPEASIIDFTETNPNIKQGLERATTFLSLVSLIALIVGALGVATAMHAHLQQRMDSIAIMKSLGATSGRIVRIYATQTLMLGLIGGLLGILIGTAVERVLPLLIARFFQVQPQIEWHPMVALQGLAAGILTTLLFTLPPLLSIRHIRPGVIFRRDMAETRPGWRERLSQSRAAIGIALIILAGIAGIASWLVSGTWRDSIKIGGAFVGGLVVSLIVLAAVAWILLKSLKLFVTATPWKLPSTLRHGIANIYRPGSQAQSVLTALGVGVMFTLTIYLVQHSVLAEINRSAPPNMANVFLLDITEQQQAPLLNLLSHQSGVEGKPQSLRTVASKLVSVNGVPVEQLQLTGMARRYRAVRSLTTVALRPEGTDVAEGAWWSAGSPIASVSVAENAAKLLKVHPGSVMEWNVFGRVIRARVSSVHKTDPNRLIGFVDFIVSPGVLDEVPSVYYAAVRVKPPLVASLQRASYEQFPTVTVVNIADVMERVQEVVDQIAIVIRFISLFTILAGVIILASSVAGTRFRRIREVVIFKTLGATRGRIALIFSAEFLILGSVAGLMGSSLASLFSALLLKRFFKADFHFDPWPGLVCILLTALVAAAAGWLASFRILGQKPLEVLRNE